jgi:hypothetical protein
MRIAPVAVGRRLDAGEANLAAILQAKTARIDHSRDAALALRFEGASRRACGVGRGSHEHESATRDCGAARAPKFDRYRRWLHGSMFAQAAHSV